MDYQYGIAIEDCNSAGIKHLARQLGVTHMRRIGFGYSGGRTGKWDYGVGFYAILDPRTNYEIRVANTNADPIWEEDDEGGFAELAEECGVKLD